MSGWIGVDLDGTLAFYDGKWGLGPKIGKPIPTMLARVKRWLAEGREVRIFTARAFDLDGKPILEQIEAIEAYCLEHVGRVLAITNRKDFGMLECWDDRSVQVEMNTGRVLGYSTRDLDAESSWMAKMLADE